MKKTPLQFSLLALMLWATSSAYAASCQEDFNSIAKTIKYDKLILTKNQFEVISISGHPRTGADGSCDAHGIARQDFFRGYLYSNVKVSWKMGKWRSTIVAHFRHSSCLAPRFREGVAKEV